MRWDDHHHLCQRPIRGRTNNPHGERRAETKISNPLTKEPLLISFATTEPGMGSDIAGIKTTCERDGDEYVLNGSNMFIINGNHADFIVIFAGLKGTRHDMRDYAPSSFPAILKE